MTESATSPAASGPAGSQFEGQVGAFYLLSMLTGAEPRGLPGTTIDRNEMQRAAEGRPLDDVIVKAHDGQGAPAVFEIQVKRSIAFSRSDPIFRKVVGQIVQASRRADFWNTRYELAVATARTSQKIDGAYQDVLTWARKIGDPATFTDRVNRPGSANDDMRGFLSTFRHHLEAEQAPADDAAVWGLLRKLQILIFDFTAVGSASEALVKERAIRALHTDDTGRASDLWAQLVAFAIDRAASGGDCDRGELIAHLKQQGFRLAGERRFRSARNVLAEASRNALGDIEDHIGDFVLTRPELMAAVRTALDTSRYVEIRGDAGVGKSAVLKHLAEQVSTETQVVVLSPGRTTPRGWMAMRAMLGFDGSAHELLTDLAGDGGSLLFIDNLDQFNEDEQRTVSDLVREGAGIPGFKVVATARSAFATDEPHWLLEKALDALGRTNPVVIGELTDGEVEQIRQAAPSLAPLLADRHPARPIARNLFRLARLSRVSGDESTPRTEVDMAQTWWKTADGKPGSAQRERARLLRALAERSLSTTDSMDVAAYPSSAIDALVSSETLRDHGNDRVAFRHDVLREWAIASLLDMDPMWLERLSLTIPASAALARGVELASRMALERSDDDRRWRLLIARLSVEYCHGSWRRAALLAVVRSEIANELLIRASDTLFADHAAMLRELIRTVIAVDVIPASSLWAAVGIELARVPAGINVPSGDSWRRLILWLLSLGDTLPPAAIPDVVDFYVAWSIGRLGQDSITPYLNSWLYRWLSEIDTAHNASAYNQRAQLFSGQLSTDSIRSLESALRTGFLAFCNWTPELARQYLIGLANRKRDYQESRSILQFPGMLAQAAPSEFAEMIVRALIPGYDQRHGFHEERDGPFDILDLEFFPASGTKGPCWDLLRHAPEHGLSLIRRLVDHAVFYYTKGRDPGEDIISISLPDGDRSFPWAKSYRWSRQSSGHNCLTHGLLALESWGNARIECGEPFDAVLVDILGLPGSPAAFLLVAVDLILCHWPQSRDAAIPFVGCPELLCIDRERWSIDVSIHPRYLGLSPDQSDTGGQKDSECQLARRVTLTSLLGQYACCAPVESREKLVESLRVAAERLGPPSEKDNLGVPSFMVVHALNSIDPRNYREVSYIDAAGEQQAAMQYVSPVEERLHLDTLEASARSIQMDFEMQNRLMLALDDESHSSHEFAVAAVEWAMASEPNQGDVGDFEERTRREAVVTAALIAMRDADSEFRERMFEWALGILSEALRAEKDPVHRVREGLHFNGPAIAFLGLAYALRHRKDAAALGALLGAAGSGDPAAAHGLRVAAPILAATDERLPRAVMRCAFAACVRPAWCWDLPEPETVKRSERHRERVKCAIAAEIAWLEAKGAEPDWPAFSARIPQCRQRGLLVGPNAGAIDPAEPTSQSDETTDHQAAALWLSGTSRLIETQAPLWLRGLVWTYASWTLVANGQAMGADMEISDMAHEWNHAYFGLLAHCLPGAGLGEIETRVLAPIGSLPDEPFFEVLTTLLREIDDLYFNKGIIEEGIAVRIRKTLADRLMASTNWRWFARDRGFGIEMHLGAALARLFFNDYGYGQPGKCYLLDPAVDRLNPFLSVLERLILGAPSLYIAGLTLNVLEVSPRVEHLALLVSATEAWLDRYANRSDFWLDYRVGERVCGLIERIRCNSQDSLLDGEPIRSRVDRALSVLVSAGLADARRLEESLAAKAT